MDRSTAQRTDRAAWSRWLVVLCLVPGCSFDPSGRSVTPGSDARPDATLPDGGRPDSALDASPGDPDPPLGVSIPARAGLCPAQTVNADTVTAVEVVVTLGPTSRSSQLVYLRVEGGGNVTEPALRAATDGSGTVAFGVELSPFADGPLTLAAAVVGSGGVRSPEITHAARKDTVIDLWVDPVVTPVPATVTSQQVSGMTEPAAELVVGNTTLGATAAAMADADGYFEAVIPLGPGSNQIDLRATDAAWNEAHQWVDRFAGSMLVDVVPGGPGVIFTEESATRLAATVASSPCSDSAAASFAFVRAPDLVAGDVAPDLYINCVNQLFLNDGQGFFTSLATAGLQGDRGAVWGDFDNDGDQDVALVRSASSDLRLYRNELIPGGTVSFSLTAGLLPYNPGNPEGVAWIDYNRDGWLDLFLNDGFRNELQQGGGPGQIFTIVGDGVGVNTLGDPLNNGSWIAVSDFDANGEVDIAVSDDVGRGFLLASTSAMFSDVTTSAAADFINPAKRGLTFGDFDNNGCFDLFVPQGAVLGPGNALLRYDAPGGVFTDVAAAAGVDQPLAHDGAAWGDVDLDGRLDLVYYTLPGGGRIDLVLQLNRGDTNSDGIPDFETFTQEHILLNPAGFSPDSALLADVDNDGDLDLLIASRNGGHLLFVNPLTRPAAAGRAQNPRYLRVLLFGNGVDCNRTALGSVVLLRDCATQTLLGTREVNGGRGNGGQDSPVLHFGGLLPSRCVQVEARFLGGAYVIQQVRPIELPSQTLLVFQP